MAEQLKQSLNPADYIQLSGPLFEAVQLSRILPDSKTFVDSVPLGNPPDILGAYHREKGRQGFYLKQFVTAYFQLPEAAGPDHLEVPPTKPIDAYLHSLWPVLTRQADTYTPGSTLIPLPKPYIVPGGRFGEVYYWDSLQTEAGLLTSGDEKDRKMAVNMCDNFAHQIDTVGFIPNGNRIYYTTRTQPPVFALMVALLGQNGYPIQKYLPQLEKEHAYLTKGNKDLHHESDATEGVVMTKDRIVLARNYDTARRPREESHFEDFTNAQEITPEGRTRFYLDLRAAASSGWDFSSRWFKDLRNITTIHTTDIIPVDKNCLLYFEELLTARLHQNAGNSEQSAYYSSLADNRRFAIQELFWSKNEGFFFDHDFVAKKLTDSWSMAAVLPLFTGIATTDQAASVAKHLEDKFLKTAGFAATLHETGQQWDYPNGWPPLQWFAIHGLRRYGFDKLADEATECWLKACKTNYQLTGGMYEKYNVIDPTARAKGGEYPTQIGFGWTNGSYLDLRTRTPFIP